jgi:hypothetical protein
MKGFADGEMEHTFDCCCLDKILQSDIGIMPYKMSKIVCYIDWMQIFICSVFNS